MYHLHCRFTAARDSASGDVSRALVVCMIGYMVSEELIATPHSSLVDRQTRSRAWMLLWEFAQSCANEARDLMRELELI
jgi:hypothetical protein